MVAKRLSAAKRLENTAYQEAGHAVMRWTQRRAFRTVSITPQEDSLGRVTLDPAGDWFDPDLNLDARTRARAEDDIMFSFAGDIAASIHTGEVTTWTCPKCGHLTPGTTSGRGAAADDHHAVGLAMYMGGSTGATEAYLEWLRRRTLDALRVPYRWAAVEALVKALMERRRITWKDARRVMWEAAFPTIPWGSRRLRVPAASAAAAPRQDKG